MSDLLAQTVPLSLAAAISPLVLMGMLALLGGASSKKHAIAYAIGVIGMTVLMLTVGLAVVELQKGKTSGGPAGSPTADVVIGVLLIAVAALMVRPHRRSDEEKAKAKHRQLIKPNAPLAAFTLLGAALMLSNFSTIVVLLAILRNVAQANASIGESAIALAIVAFITVLPATVPLCAALFGGPALSAKITSLGAWTTRNGKYILAALFFVFGLQDLLKAFGS